MKFEVQPKIYPAEGCWLYNGELFVPAKADISLPWRDSHIRAKLFNGR